MDQIQNQGQLIVNAFNDLLSRFVNFLPGLIGAIVILVIGLIIAAAVGKLVEKLVKMLGIDSVIARLQHEITGRPGREVRASVILKEVVKWFLIFVFLIAASQALGLDQLSVFLNNILMYLPNVIVAVIILTIAMVLAKYVSEIVMRSHAIATSNFESDIVAAVVKWAIIIFGVLAALIQLRIAPSLINSLAIGIIAAISLALGLAFGLGGQDEAARMLKNFREKMLK